jgi:hypothetical protein
MSQLLPISRKTLVLMVGIVTVVLFAAWVIHQSQKTARYPDAPAKITKQLRFEDRSSKRNCFVIFAGASG